MIINIITMKLMKIININKIQILEIDIFIIESRILLFNNKKLLYYQLEFNLSKLLYFSIYNIKIEFNQRIFII